MSEIIKENSDNNKLEDIDYDLLVNISNYILSTLREDRKAALEGMRKDLAKKIFETDLKQIPEELKLKLKKSIDIVATSQDIWQVNYHLHIFQGLVDAIYNEAFHEKKEIIEKNMAECAARLLSSLPDDVAPPSYWEKVTQSWTYQRELTELARRYYDSQIFEKEVKGKFDLADALQVEADVLREKSEIIEVKKEGDTILEVHQKHTLPHTSFVVQEFYSSKGDLELQSELVEAIEKDIKEIILYIGTDSIHEPVTPSKYSTLENHKIHDRLKAQRKGRKQAEERKYQQELTSEDLEEKEEWLQGAREREARMLILKEYRQEKHDKILKHMAQLSMVMEDLKVSMEENDPSSVKYKKSLANYKKAEGEYLYLQSNLMDLEKLYHSEYGYYLWRKEHHERFLVDQIRNAWGGRSNQTQKEKIKRSIKELRHTREYGYNYKADNDTDRPRGLS